MPSEYVDPAISTPPAAPAGDIYRDYLKSSGWRITRNDALRRAKWTCARCHGKRNLQVHHKTYERLGCEWADDLEVLCAVCHEGHHADKGKPETLGIYLRLIHVTLAEHPDIETIADLSDTLKSRCVRERIPYNADQIDRAIQIAGMGAKRAKFAQAARMPTVESASEAATWSDESIREFFRTHGLQQSIKTMPKLEPTTRLEVNRRRAMALVEAEMQACIDRCAALEAAVGK